jgi:hypothetical protein
MKDAYGQALGYARSFDRPPPFIIVCDIGHCFDLYAAFDGSGNYRRSPTRRTTGCFSRSRPSTGHLRASSRNPLDLDPSKHSGQDHARSGGAPGRPGQEAGRRRHDQELIAQFLMRCLFTMFAEDVGLLPEGLFTRALKEQWLPHPASSPARSSTCGAP